MRTFLRREVPGLSLLVCALIFGAVCLAPELEITRAAVNDDIFHLTASERLLDAFRRGEPFLDPWVSEFALGYPVWRSYQPLPHALAAAVLGLTDSFTDHTTAYAWLKYLLLVLWPASVYVGARALGLRSVAAGLAALFVLASSSTHDFGRFGIAYGSFVWRGSGLFTQIVALHSFVLALGATSRALDSGKGRDRALAAAALAATGLCHIVFGYVVALSACVMAAVAPADKRSSRLAQVGLIGALSALLALWFVVPLAFAKDSINHSRWESTYKWDSFGAQQVLHEIVSGDLFDADRHAFLSLIVVVGVVVALRHRRESLPQRLLALAGLWLVLFFGRATWGELLTLFGVPADLHLHRVQGAFEIFALLLAAWGCHRLITTLRASRMQIALVAVLAGFVALMGRERADYLDQNARWGYETLAALNSEAADIAHTIDDVRTLLKKTPGRASAGLAAGWGHEFTVGSIPFYGVLSRSHIAHADFLYHSMSKASEVMTLRIDGIASHLDAYGIRVVVAPATKSMPDHFHRYSTHGRFAVYEASSEGYFGLVDVTGVYTGPKDTFFEAGSTWLSSGLPTARQVVALRQSTDLPLSLTQFPRWTPMIGTPGMTACGTVTSESLRGDSYVAAVSTERDCYVSFKMTWDAGFVATVDGAKKPMLEVTPGFSAIPVSRGRHHVEVRYAPGPLRPLLWVLGLVCFVLAAAWPRTRGYLETIHVQLTAALEKARARVHWPGSGPIVALVGLGLLALRPLFRGKMVDGHDASEYLARLVEFKRIIGDGHLPPVWAPDLGAGHGQPLFEFAPPLVYVAAFPFYLLGANLADSLQWGLAVLHGIGAFAIYRLARRFDCTQVAAVGVTATWLFAPYTAIDLYVRGAFAEASAVAMAPLAVMLLLRCLEVPTISTAMAAACGVGLVILAHNAAALLLLPAFGVLVLAVATTHRTRIAGASALALGLAVSAYFWFPAFTEKSYVQTDLLREGFLHWSEHYVAWFQLLWSRWDYGLSFRGPNDGMSFAVGLPQLGLALLGLFFAVRQSTTARRMAIAFCVIAFAGAWVSTESSSLLWEHAPPLQYLALPWRALMLPGLFLPLLSMWAFPRLHPRLQLAAIAVVVGANITHTEPKGYLTYDEEFYSANSIAEKGLCTTTREEYAPRDVHNRPPYSKLKILDDTGQLSVLSQHLESTKQRFDVKTPASVVAELGTFAYPGWVATVDDREVPLVTVPERGTQLISIPAGEHTVRLELHPTPARRWSTWLSVATLLATIAVAVSRRVRGRAPALEQASTIDTKELPLEHLPTTRSGIFASAVGPDVAEATVSAPVPANANATPEVPAKVQMRKSRAKARKSSSR